MRSREGDGSSVHVTGLRPPSRRRSGGRHNTDDHDPVPTETNVCVCLRFLTKKFKSKKTIVTEKTLLNKDIKKILFRAVQCVFKVSVPRRMGGSVG